ncbi:BolA protein [Rhodovulum bhavnagarense]|uniref:BolA protein n=1 Tax=Rhodovulum bhavnagarense TaxID=992286 RepID=A0A4R2RFM4_9RHOB|nr:BolA family protein [Rhodovulum bhavnagarense]TCP62412.1 BolA protein [Rhodovulum bhavnagarense]
MPLKDEIHSRLQTAFAPTVLRVLDESERHRGHAGWHEGGETHFRVTIAAPALSGLSRLARHRAVHTALGKDLMSRIHALALNIEA